MNKKALGIIVCTLLIFGTVIPVAGNIKMKSSPPSFAINTSVDKIAPYIIGSSPITITATGASDLDSVTLYYRWSIDNASWTGIHEYTVFEGFESGVQNTDLWNTYQTGNDARIQWDYGSSHGGSNSCSMDDYDTNTGDFALNVIYTNIDFTDTTEISVNFWEREWGDEANNAPDTWGGWGPYDVVAFTNDGNTWYEIVSESELNSQSWKEFDYDITDDPDFSSPADSNFRIAFQQYDNYRLTQDGRAWDDITIDYSVGAGIDWSFWFDFSNPDQLYPWSWNFNFPNGTGYYEFYSIGEKTGEVDETPPLVADAQCRFNNLPAIFDEEPESGSINIDINPQLNISISDAEGEEMSLYWYSNSSGSWQVFGSNISVGDGTYSQYNSNFSEFGNRYYWYVTADDELNTNTSSTFNFKTYQNYPPYTPSNPSPSNGENNVKINEILSWTGGDPNGDDVTYDVYFGKSSSPPKVESNHPDTTYNPGLLDFDTKYYWKIVARDFAGLSTSGPTWSFTTEDNLPPNTPSNPDPEDEATHISIGKVLKWTGGDPNVGDPITYDVYFGTDSPPPFVGTEENHAAFDPGTMELGTTYYWQIVSKDSGGLTKTGPIWQFTTQFEPNEPPTAPDIYGPPSGPKGVELFWAIVSEDPDENQVRYLIEWGDGDSEETDFYQEGLVVEASHSYEEGGTFTIKVKAEDEKGSLSEETTFELKILKSKSVYHPLLLRLFERFPILVKLLNLIRL